MKGLEKIAASADIPMLVAGDFNSIPGSAAHSLLTKHAVEAGHAVSEAFKQSCAPRSTLATEAKCKSNNFVYRTRSMLSWSPTIVSR